MSEKAGQLRLRTFGHAPMSAVTPVGSMKLGDHHCLGFDTEDDQHEIVRAFVGDGLAANHQVLYFADSTEPASVASWLEAGGLVVRDAIDRGQLVVATAAEAYAPRGFFEPDATITTLREHVATALGAGYSGLRVTSEMAWAQGSVPGRHGLFEYEAEVRQVFDTGMAMGLCQYDLRRFASSDLPAIREVHAGLAGPNPIYADAQLRITRTLQPRGLTFDGELDAWNVESVARELRTRLGGCGDLDLDLNGLVFCDVGGLRALVDLAESVESERRLVLHGLPSRLRAVMELVGWSDLPGLVIAREVAA